MWGLFVFKIAQRTSDTLCRCLISEVGNNMGQAFDSLLLPIDRLVQLVEQIFRKAQFDFQFGDALFQHDGFIIHAGIIASSQPGPEKTLGRYCKEISRPWLRTVL